MEIIDSTGNIYRTRSTAEQYLGYALATIASGGIMKGLSLTGNVFHKELVKEQVNNEIYKTHLYKALDLLEIKKLGIEIIPAQFNQQAFPVEAAGKNACYIPNYKKIIINTDKISHAGFHELGHAMNELLSKYGVKYLQKMRKTGYIIAGIMEFFAVTSRPKPKNAKKNALDKVEDNCGLITFAALLPTVAEEAIASWRGTNLAKKSGLSDAYVKNLKKLYKKALLTYGGHAVLAGFAVWASRQIMDYFTRPKKIANINKTDICNYGSTLPTLLFEAS